MPWHIMLGQERAYVSVKAVQAVQESPACMLNSIKAPAGDCPGHCDEAKQGRVKKPRISSCSILANPLTPTAAPLRYSSCEQAAVNQQS